MVSTKRTPRKVRNIEQAAASYRCLPCNVVYRHRQSLNRHLRSAHSSTGVVQPLSLQGLPLLEDVDEFLLPEEAPVPAPAPAAESAAVSRVNSESDSDSTTGQVRGVVVSRGDVSASSASEASCRLVPRKRIAKSAALDLVTRLWPSPPAVSTADLYTILESLPGASPGEIADVVVRRFRLSGNAVPGLRNRLSAMVFAWQVAQQEVRKQLPVDLDGNSAIAFVHRVAAWTTRNDRPVARPFE